MSLFVDANKCSTCKPLLEKNGFTLDKNASESEVARAFRKWAVRNHPDKGGNSETFAEVSACIDAIKQCHSQYGSLWGYDTSTPYGSSTYSNFWSGQTNRSWWDYFFGGSSYSNYYSKPKESQPPPKSSKPKAPPKPRPPPKSSKPKKPCTPEQIRNPSSGRCVKRDGAIGRKILREQGKPPNKQKSPKKKECRKDQIVNPASGKCVKRDGAIGRKILREQGGDTSDVGRKPCTKTQIRNPSSGRCVKRDGKIGKKILGESPKKSPKKKSSKKGKFDGMTVPQLKEMLKDCGVKGYSRLRKDELIKLARKSKC